MAGVELRVPLKAISKDNVRIKNKYTGRIFTNPVRFRIFNAAFAALVKQRLPRDFKMLTGFLRGEFIFHFANRKHADSWNLPKSCADVLQGILYENDKAFCDGRQILCYCGDEAISVRVWETTVNEGECVDPPKGGRT